MYRITNIFNSTKEMKKILAKNDVLLSGSFIRRNGKDIIWITKSDRLQSVLARFNVNTKEVFANEQGTEGIIVNIKDNTGEVVRFNIVPKVRKFINKLEDRIIHNKENITIEMIAKDIMNSYHLDLMKIENNIIPNITSLKGNLESRKFLDGIEYVIDVNSGYIKKFNLKLTDMVLNFLNQDTFFKYNSNDPVLFSTEQIEAVYEDILDEDLAYECLHEANHELYELLGEPEYVRINGRNMNWRGSSAYKVTRETDKLVSECIPSYDSTTELMFDLETYKPYIIQYSHDCPTGSFMEFEIISEEEYEEER